MGTGNTEATLVSKEFQWCQ